MCLNYYLNQGEKTKLDVNNYAQNNKGANLIKYA